MDVVKRGDERCRDAIVFVDERTVDARSRAVDARVDAPRVRYVAGLGLDLGRLRRVGVHARVGRVAGLSLDDRGNDPSLGLKSEGGGDRSSGRRASLATVLAPGSLPPVVADTRAPALLAVVSLPPVLTDLRAPALLALASPPPVLADTRAPALLAVPSLPPVLADGRAPALLAPVSLPPVLADLRAPALLAAVLHPPVLADLRAPALLALPSLPPVLADPLPRAFLAKVPSVALPVRALRTRRSLRLPRARSLAETLRHVVARRVVLAERDAPRSPRRRGFERFIFLGRDDVNLSNSCP